MQPPIRPLQFNMGGRIENVDHLQTVPLTGGKVVKIVSGCHLDRPRAKFEVDQNRVRDDGYATPR